MNAEQPQNSPVEVPTGPFKRTIRSLFRPKEPLIPVADCLLGSSKTLVWYILALAACMIPVLHAEQIIALTGANLPSTLVVTVAIIAFGSHLALAPLSISFRALLGLHLLVMMVCILYLLLVMTGSPLLSIVFPICFAAGSVSWTLKNPTHLPVTMWRRVRLFWDVDWKGLDGYFIQSPKSGLRGMGKIHLQRQGDRSLEHKEARTKADAHGEKDEYGSGQNRDPKNAR